MAIPGNESAEDGRVSSTWLVPTLTLATLVNSASVVALGPFLPLVAEELGASVALLGQVPSAMMLLAALLGLVIGPLADQYGYRRTLVAGLLAAALSSLGMAVAPDFLPLMLAGLLGAIGRAAVMPTAMAVLGMQYLDEDRRRWAISWVQTGHTSSALLGVPLLLAIAAFSGWRVSFLLASGIALSMVLLLWRMLAADRVRSGTPWRLRTILSAYTPLLHHRPTLALIGQSFLSNAGSFAAFTYLGAYLVERHDFTAPQVGAAYLGVGVGAVLGAKLVGGKLGAHPRRLLLITPISGGLMLGVALILPLPMLAALGLVTLSVVAQAANAAATAVVLVGESPAGRATTLTVNSSALSLGWGVGGAVGGLALAVGGYPALGLVSLSSLLSAAGLVWWSRPREAPPSPVTASG